MSWLARTSIIFWLIITMKVEVTRLAMNPQRNIYLKGHTMGVYSLNSPFSQKLFLSLLRMTTNLKAENCVTDIHLSQRSALLVHFLQFRTYVSITLNISNLLQWCSVSTPPKHSSLKFSLSSSPMMMNESLGLGNAGPLSPINCKCINKWNL